MKSITYQESFVVKGSLHLGQGSISNLERCPCSRGEPPGSQSSCNSGRAQTRLILMVIFIERSSWLLVNTINKTFVFVLALVLYFSCLAFWGFNSTFWNIFMKHLHFLVCEAGASQLVGATQGIRSGAP